MAFKGGGVDLWLHNNSKMIPLFIPPLGSASPSPIIGSYKEGLKEQCPCGGYHLWMKPWKSTVLAITWEDVGFISCLSGSQGMERESERAHGLCPWKIIAYNRRALLVDATRVFFCWIYLHKSTNSGLEDNCNERPTLHLLVGGNLKRNEGGWFPVSSQASLKEETIMPELFQGLKEFYHCNLLMWQLLRVIITSYEMGIHINLLSKQIKTK